MVIFYKIQTSIWYKKSSLKDLTEGQTLAGYKAGVWCFLEPPMEEADLVVEQPGGGSSKGETQVL